METPDPDPHQQIASFVFTAIFQSAEPDEIIGIFVMALLLFLSALVSGSEIAYFSLSPVKLDQLKKDNNSVSNLILKHLDNPRMLLATILISNNFINVGIVILSTYVMSGLFDFGGSPLMGFVVQVILVTALILFLGEILPKTYATQRPLRFASFMARPLQILQKIFYPFSLVLMNATHIIDKKVSKKGHNISMDELSDAIDITGTGEEQPGEKQMLKGIVKFGDIEVRDVMRARVDVVAADFKLPYDQLISLILDSGFSRIPVYEDNPDNIKGILYIKDLLPYLKEPRSFDWNKKLRPVFYVPENKKINDLLKEFQEKKIHLAMVVDEYGGTSGIITLEDIIEEIVGEITDEFDDSSDEVNYEQLDKNNWIFDAKTSINDFCKITDVDDRIFAEVKGDADSLAGLVLEITGDLPDIKEHIRFRNFDFEIQAVDERRIKSIKVKIEETNNG